MPVNVLDISLAKECLGWAPTTALVDGLSRTWTWVKEVFAGGSTKAVKSERVRRPTYGAHMWGFTPVPWVHVLFPERVVLRVRAEYYRPGQIVERYEDIVGHLNRMTVGRFEQYAVEAGFKIRVFRVNPDKDRTRHGILRPINSVINATPILRELGSQLLLAILDKP